MNISNRFIEKLLKENKIKLSEPSDDVCKSYLSKSEKSLLSSKTLLKIGNFDDATALTYYSMYYSVLGLLFKAGIKSENHTGSIILLKELFDIDNSEIKNAKKERVDKQYYVDFKATSDEVDEGIKIAEEFNDKIRDKIENIKVSEIETIIKKFKEEYL